jgi:SAM-dependent methyltransferase
MRIFQKAGNTLCEQGLWVTIVKFYILIKDYAFDVQYGTDTFMQTKFDDLTINSNNKDRGVYYQPTRVMPLIKLFENIKSMIPANSIFVDFGCGKGRVLLIASQFGFKEARGVEFARELCTIARNNCATYKAKTGVRTRFQITESDVVDYDIDTDDNVFFYSILLMK